VVCLACNPFNADHTETRVAYGAGAQLRFDRLAARVDYERIMRARRPESPISRANVDVQMNLSVPGKGHTAARRSLPPRFRSDR